MFERLGAVADIWIGRRASVSEEALGAVDGLAPAVVVTGGSRGIGRAIARRFADAGHTIVIVARDGEALDATAHALAQASGATVLSLTLDVTHPDAPSRLDTGLAAAGVYLDVLVNNAGIGLAGRFPEQGLADIERLLALNVTAATRLMHHALPQMLARGRGGVLNVASLGGLVPGPYQAAYYASKAYLISLTEAVAFETRGRGVRIAAVAPGPVQTTFHASMGADGALYRSVVPALSAERAARSAYRGYRLGRTVIVPGLLPSAAALAVKLLPHAVSVPLVAALLAVDPPASAAPRR